MMIKRCLSAAVLAAAALAVPLGGTPASAGHTLCDNEPTDRWVDQFGVLIGADIDDLPAALYLCVNNVLVVIRVGGPTTICSHYTNNNDPSDDSCTVLG